VVAPVMSGGGTQIKVLEALAYGRGLVVSEFAWRGFSAHFRHAEETLVANSDRDWIEQCVQLITRPELADELGRRGRQAVVEAYSFESMARIVAADLSRLCLLPTSQPA
jgi:spore maturation protein CgeB